MCDPEELLIVMRDIHAEYNGIEVIKGINFSLKRGEAHALVGEHRAGKSTLIKIISGAIKKTKGEIFIKGKIYENLTPRLALEMGIATVYQNTNIVPTLNATEYINSGRMSFNFLGMLARSRMEQETEKLFRHFGIDIDIRMPLGALPEDKQLMVELMKAISINPDIIIFDEISNKLTPVEMETVYRILSECKQKNKSAIYISHNFDEIFAISDRVTIMNKGRISGTEDIENLDRGKLIKMTYSFVLTRDELNQNNRELLYLKKYNETVIKNIPLGVIVLDAIGNTYIINNPALKMLGKEEKEVHDIAVDEVFNTESMPIAVEIIENIKKKKEGFWREVSNNKGIVYRIASYPFNDGELTFWGTIIIMEDITRERLFNDYLIRTEKIASVAELAASVAHEINNPIGICINYLELLDRHVSDEDNRIKINKVRNELNRVSEIIKDLLSFTKIKSTPYKEVNVADTIESLLSFMKNILMKNDIEIIWNRPTEAILINGDENRLKQVFLNLIKNSMESFLSKGIIEIRLSTVFDKNIAEIAIKDNGPGIPVEIIDKIFDPFFSTKNSRNNSGLGLSICQHIIEAHQGIIECESGKEGTIMVIKLPLLRHMHGNISGNQKTSDISEEKMS